MLARIAGMLMALVLVACGGTGTQPAPASGPPPSGLTIMGDSVAFRMGPYSFAMGVPFYGSINLGVGGAPTSQIKLQIPSIPATTKWLLLEGGGDDILQGTMSQIVPNYISMLNTIPSRLKIVMVGIFHVDSSNTTIDAINAQLNPLCAQHANCTVASGAQHLNMAGLTVDGIHPNLQGYQLIATSLRPYFK